MERLMYILNELDDTILWETEEKLIEKTQNRSNC